MLQVYVHRRHAVQNICFSSSLFDACAYRCMLSGMMLFYVVVENSYKRFVVHIRRRIKFLLNFIREWWLLAKREMLFITAISSNFSRKILMRRFFLWRMHKKIAHPRIHNQSKKMIRMNSTEFSVTSCYCTKRLMLRVCSRWQAITTDSKTNCGSVADNGSSKLYWNAWNHWRAHKTSLHSLRCRFEAVFLGNAMRRMLNVIHRWKVHLRRCKACLARVFSRLLLLYRASLARWKATTSQQSRLRRAEIFLTILSWCEVAARTTIACALRALAARVVTNGALRGCCEAILKIEMVKLQRRVLIAWQRIHAVSFVYQQRICNLTLPAMHTYLINWRELQRRNAVARTCAHIVLGIQLATTCRGILSIWSKSCQRLGKVSAEQHIRIPHMNETLSAVSGPKAKAEKSSGESFCGPSQPRVPVLR